MAFVAALPAWVSVAMTVASTAVSVIGALRQGRAAQQSANHNAAIADRNAQIARQQAGQEAAQIARENRLRLGAARAKAGASGVTIEGSVVDVLGDLVSQGELTRQQALYRGEIRAMGFADTAGLERARGKGAKSASFFKAGSALLGGATQAGSQYDAAYGESAPPEPVLRRA